LCLQDDIAERVIAMLKGAMRELAIGDPALLATDIGPVIDDDARMRLLAHLEQMRRTARWHFELPLPESASHGTFVAPFVCEIGSVAELMEEVFGPVLHIVRFARGELDRLLDDIGATGYGLTMGVHSRIDETIAAVARRSRAGNLYVNRNMIGAVVGVQPFGGEGLSGTGPKAGGPLYVARLTRNARVCASRLEGARRVAEPQALELFESWLAEAAPLDAASRAALLMECASLRQRSLYGLELEFAGPTGERNTLRFCERGTVVLLAPDARALMRQIAFALATANRAILPGSELARALYAQLPAALREVVEIHGRAEDWHSRDIAAVLFEGKAEEAQAIRKMLAAREGAIVPLILVKDGRCALERLIAEKATSVNTAAAGGNATLMRLE
jgi:RHH-type proline utilization regulon transcriptional repressor/proline dehydrogenase/delta 1-pyrroline-5-carboxylate dehydrogenase